MIIKIWKQFRGLLTSDSIYLFIIIEDVLCMYVG